MSKINGFMLVHTLSWKPFQLHNPTGIWNTRVMQAFKTCHSRRAIESYSPQTGPRAQLVHAEKDASSKKVPFACVCPKSL